MTDPGAAAGRPAPSLNARARGWLRFLWRKATTPDDWSERGTPHPWWDRYSSEPVLSFPRFDLSESSYAVAVMADQTPAWREVYGRILEELVRRHTTYWAAIDWLTQLGPDPRRASYPQEWIDLYLPSHLVGRYDVPGWVANGIPPWGLQPDPIGADGNLFFKGWLNLVMALHAYVTGEDRWGRPFEVAGLDGARFTWTQHRLTELLADQWARSPAGPHCENTKVWPYCLNAAGLGLMLYDGLFGTARHQAYRGWLARTRGDYFGVERDELRWVALYYDPLIRHRQTVGPTGGLAVSWYMAPQEPAFAELLYRGAVKRTGWSDPARPVRPLADPRFAALGRILAAEWGDDVTARRLGAYAERHFGPRFFGEDDAEFGWWFGFDEPWPRGQLSALLMVAEVAGPGAWQALFRRPSLARFEAPTVEGVDFPTLGVGAAWNDESAGVLHLETYAATPGLRGAPTSFRVTGLPDSSRVDLRIDGQESRRWRALSPSAIEIESDVDRHRFVLQTGYRGPGGRRRSVGAAPSGGTPADSPPLGRPALRVRSVGRSRGVLVPSGPGCPCCA